jgi:hypothetical protein
MPLTITATVVDPQNKPLPNLDAQVCTFALTGAPRVIGTGRTGADGKLSILCTWTSAADYQPRVQLQIKRGTAFVEATENPTVFNATTCDFGTVAFDATARLTLPPTAMLAVTVAEADELRGRVANLDKNLATKEAELRSKEAKLAEIEKSEGTETSIDGLAQSAAQQLQQTQSRLRKEQAGFQLGKVSLQLKVLPGRSGSTVALPRASDIQKVSAGGLSMLNLEFLPSTASKAVSSRPTVPRVLGYTEAMARRKLAEQRLGVELSYQLVTNASDEGRVVLQVPDPGAQMEEGSIVLIALGKKG